MHDNELDVLGWFLLGLFSALFALALFGAAHAITGGGL
jgi:hypothetical protein